MFHVSFEDQNIRIGRSRWLFERRHAMRFEWVALLALRKATIPADKAWTSLDDIACLPSWSGKTHRHIATNVGRYLKALEQMGAQPVAAKTRWAGPYRLETAVSTITFDLPLAEVSKRLRVGRQQHAIARSNSSDSRSLTHGRNG